MRLSVRKCNKLAQVGGAVAIVGAFVLYSGYVAYAWIPGRMTGGGSVFPLGKNAVTSAQLDNNNRITHGFEIHCGTDADNGSDKNSLEINWKDLQGKQHKFHLDDHLISAHCEFVTIVGSPDPPPADFNWFEGYGTGKYDNKSGATIHFIFTDSSEPGGTVGDPPADTAFYDIKDANGNQALLAGTFTPVDNANGFGDTLNVGGLPLEQGNQQAHNN